MWLHLDMVCGEAGDDYSAGSVLQVLPGTVASAVGLICSSVVSSPCSYRKVHTIVLTTSHY